MGSQETIYVLGSGAIGFPLAAYLIGAGRDVVAVRTGRQDIPPSTVTVTVHNETNPINVPVATISLSQLAHLDGLIVITAKSFANEAIALELKEKAAAGPIVILQNGIGVEKPFLNTYFPQVYRCVLYITSQAQSKFAFTIRPITASPIGIVKGDEPGLQTVVTALTTDGFPFRSETNIQREVWKKVIINAVFNSVCPLLDVDNGIFVRDENAGNLAHEIVRECVTLTDRLGIGLSERELMEQLMRISQGSNGQLISTLQDIRAGRQTEIEFLNLEIARIASQMQPTIHLPKVELLGKMIVVKSSLKAD